MLPAGEKPFFCPSNGCEKTFSTQYSLKSHMKGHEKGHSYNALPNNNVSEVSTHLPNAAALGGDQVTSSPKCGFVSSLCKGVTFRAGIYRGDGNCLVPCKETPGCLFFDGEFSFSAGIASVHRSSIGFIPMCFVHRVLIINSGIRISKTSRMVFGCQVLFRKAHLNFSFVLMVLNILCLVILLL